MTLRKTAMYTWNASDYAQSSSLQQQWARELIARLGLRRGQRVLDIGCGDGKVTAEIAASAGFVLGVDNSPEMIALAKHSFPADNLRFQLADASDLPFDHEFDIIFSNATLHWVKDHRPVLAGIARSLAAGGRILLQMGGKGNASGVVAAMDSVRTRPQWSQYFEQFTFPYGFYGPEEYQEWLDEAGLPACKASLVTKDARHPTHAAFAGWLRTTWLPYTQRVPADQRETFIEEVVETYLAAYPPVNGAVHVQMIRLEVESALPLST